MKENYQYLKYWLDRVINFNDKRSTHMNEIEHVKSKLGNQGLKKPRII